MIKYFTLLGDTLEKIASDLKVENPDYIRRFHDKYGSPFDSLDGILKTGTFLCLPFGDEIKKLNQEIIENGDSLYYRPLRDKIPFEVPLLAGTYLIHHQKLRDDKMLVEYQYQMTLEYLKWDETNHIFTIQLFDFTKDGSESDDKISDLAKACMKIIYPLEIRVNMAGQVIEVDLQTTTLHIKEELEALKKYFTDQYATSYINQLKLMIEDKKLLLEKLKNTLPIHFLFGAFYKAKYGDWTDSQIYYDFFQWLVDTSPICLEFSNRILPKDGDDEILKILQKGSCFIGENLDGLETKIKEVKKEFHTDKKLKNCFHEAEYNFRRSDLAVKKIIANFNLQIDDITEKQMFTIENDIKII